MTRQVNSHSELGEKVYINVQASENIVTELKDHILSLVSDFEGLEFSKPSGPVASLNDTSKGVVFYKPAEVIRLTPGSVSDKIRSSFTNAMEFIAGDVKSYASGFAYEKNQQRCEEIRNEGWWALRERVLEDFSGVCKKADLTVDGVDLSRSVINYVKQGMGSFTPKSKMGVSYEF